MSVGQFVRTLHATYGDLTYLKRLFLLADLATAWEAELAFDLLIFVLIIVKSYQDRVVRGWSRAVPLANVGLMQMLFLDGERQ